MNLPESDEIESPCINVCVVSPTGICVGCYRNLDEIAQWSSASDESKQAILQRCEQRKESTDHDVKESR